MLIAHSCRAFPFFWLIISASAQTPSTWREPSFRISRTGKISVAKAALDVLVAGLDLSTGMVTDPGPGLDVPQSATFIQTLSRYDQLTDDTIYESKAKAAFTAFHQRFPDFSDRWGLAAYYASTVWSQDSDTFLAGARSAWEKAFSFQLSPDIASTGHLSSINATFQSSCNGLSVQGAVLWLGRGDVLTNTETMGPFIALSSYLYNATHNSTYSEAANLTIGFMRNFLSDGSTPTQDSFYLANCTGVIPNNFTYNSGYFIEGLAAYTASTGDDSQKAFLNSLVSNSLSRTPEWYRSDGVLQEAAFSGDEYARIEGLDPDPQTLVETRLTSDWKSILVNGLYTSLRFGLLDTEIEVLVRASIATQYNAIRELANSTVNNQIVYSPSWDQQPLQVLTAWGQLAAAEVLTIALNVTTSEDTTTDTSWTSMPESSVSTSNPSGPSSTQTPPPHALANPSSLSHTGPIAGGIVGGVVVASGILTVVLCRRRQKRRLSERLRHFNLPPEPYTGTIQQYPGHERTAMIVQTADSTGRPVKLEPPVRETIPTALVSGSGPNAHSDTQLLREGAAPASGIEGLARTGRHARVSVDAGFLQRLLVGIRETRAELSDLRQRPRYGGTSQFSDPPEYGDSA